MGTMTNQNDIDKKWQGSVTNKTNMQISIQKAKKQKQLQKTKLFIDHRAAYPTKMKSGRTTQTAHQFYF